MKESKTARKPGGRSRRQEPPRRKAAPVRPAVQEKAVEDFGTAVKLFQKRDFSKAREAFKQVLERYPGEREIGDRARTYIQICDRGLHPPTPRPRDAEEFYHQGIVFLNQRSFEEASRMFERALAAEPGNDKVLYAQACALAMMGRSEDAVESLRRAVAANPANRVLASNDGDFESLRDDLEFRKIVLGEVGTAE